MKIKTIIGSLLIGCSYFIVAVFFNVIAIYVLNLPDSQIPTFGNIYGQTLFLLISITIVSGLLGLIFFNYKKHKSRIIAGIITGNLVQLPFLLIYHLLNNILYIHIPGFFILMWVLIPPILSLVVVIKLLPKLSYLK